MYQKIKACETKTVKIGGMCITKIRNMQTKQVLVTGAYGNLAIIIDASQNVLNWYEGPQAQAEYLSYTGAAVTDEYIKICDEIPSDVQFFAENLYSEALDMK